MKLIILKITDNETHYLIFIFLSNDKIAMKPRGDWVHGIKLAQFRHHFGIILQSVGWVSLVFR